MFGIRYLKMSPTTYVLHYKNGRIIREGRGLSFFYYAPTSTLVAIPLASTDLPFAFQEATADFQTVTLQGQLTYRVADAKRLASLLDFTIDPNGRRLSDDPEVLNQRLVHEAQILARASTQKRMLREVLVNAEAVAAEVLPALRQAEAIEQMGVEVMGLSLLAIKPTPEMAKALEADAREALKQQSDEATYKRRNAAVEQERKIKESELNTRIAVEEKERQVRETKMAADIAVEEQRSKLIEQKVENDRLAADSQAYALEAQLKPVRDLDWRTLMAIGSGKADPGLMIATAFRELGENAGKIGELNISPELLSGLLGKARSNGEHAAERVMQEGKRGRR